MGHVSAVTPWRLKSAKVKSLLSQIEERRLDKEVGKIVLHRTDYSLHTYLYDLYYYVRSAMW